MKKGVKRLQLLHFTAILNCIICLCVAPQLFQPPNADVLRLVMQERLRGRLQLFMLASCCLEEAALEYIICGIIILCIYGIILCTGNILGYSDMKRMSWGCSSYLLGFKKAVLVPLIVQSQMLYSRSLYAVSFRVLSGKM